MVVGNGMIAKRFGKYAYIDEILLFASGVSDSKCTDVSAYEREESLLKNAIAQNPGKTFIYISTCSIYDPTLNQSAYVMHKQKLEEYIRQKAARYTIIRTSNLAGPSGNPKTVFNFFVNSVTSGSPFQLWANASRNILDLDDFYTIVTYILDNELFLNTTINIAHPRNYKVKEIIQAIESHFNKKANYELVDKGAEFLIDISETAPILEKLHIQFDDNYLPGILNKYY